MKHEVYIDFGSGWQLMNPYVDEVSLQRQRNDNSLIVLDTVQGDAAFYGTEYDQLYSAWATNNVLPCKITFNSVAVWTGKIDLSGTYNIAEKKCNLGFTSFDPYAKILANVNKEFDILSDTTIAPFYKVTATSISKTFYMADLQQLIKSMIQNIDNTVQFDDDSFKYFNDSTYWKYLNLAFINDFAATTTSMTLSENGTISLDTILMYFEEFKIYWNLELISGVYYFRFKHISEVNYIYVGGGAYDQTDYYSTDWSLTQEGYQVDNSSRWYLRQRKLIATYPDFKGADIEVPSLENIAMIIKQEQGKFYNDVEGIFDDSTKYPTTSTNDYVMACCDVVNDVVDLDISGVTKSANPSDFNLSFVPNPGIVDEIVATLVNDTTDASYYIDGITVEKGKLCRMSFNIAVTGTISAISIQIVETVSQKAIWQSKSDFDTFPVFDDYIEFIPRSSSFEVYVIFSGSNGAQFSLNKSPRMFRELSYRSMLTAAGILEPLANRLNMPLSQAYIDDIAGKYDFYDTPAIINGTSTPVNLIKNKDHFLIKTPIKTLSEIDFEYLVRTQVGDCDAVQLNIPLSNQLSTLKLKI